MYSGSERLMRKASNFIVIIDDYIVSYFILLSSL